MDNARITKKRSIGARTCNRKRGPLFLPKGGNAPFDKLRTTSIQRAVGSLEKIVTPTPLSANPIFGTLTLRQAQDDIGVLSRAFFQNSAYQFAITRPKNQKRAGLTANPIQILS